VAGCCECGDEPLGSCATELVSYIRGQVSMIHNKGILSKKDNITE
jgi:hypothetical protein